MKRHKTQSNFLLIVLSAIFIALLALYMYMFGMPARDGTIFSPVASSKEWAFEAIDTMKYSRDLSREKLKDPTFDNIIKKQISDIARTGATHVAIATPYDAEFLPILKRWVKVARENNLKVWFRGNWSGWEGWFDYPSITRDEHIQNTKSFIINNPDLFEDGDAFTACPECENGGPGDPRSNGDVEGHRSFLISEYNATKEAFASINKKVASNLNSMNGDVARLIMDPKTTKALGGIVVVDHYVKDPAELEADVKDFAKRSQGKVVLGEFGAPIPDINGEMTEEQQAQWLSDVLERLSKTKELVGLSYWTSQGASTSLWDDNGKAKKAASILTNYYSR